jgi:hypothetical protein
LSGYLSDIIQREADQGLINGAKDCEVKLHLLMGGKRSLNDALNQA